MRSTPTPQCESCGQEMKPLTIPGGGLVAWYCVADKRLRPHTDSVTYNQNSANSLSK